MAKIRGAGVARWMAKDGADGKNAYLHIRYSAYADGQGMTAFPVLVTTPEQERSRYRGMLSNNSQYGSSDYRDYEWEKMSEDGKAGLTVSMTKESHVYPATANGDVQGGYESGYSGVRIYAGSTQFTCNTTAETLPTADGTYTVLQRAHSAGIQSGLVVVDNQIELRPSQMSAELTATITLTIAIKHDDEIIYVTKTVSYSKAKQGAANLQVDISKASHVFKGEAWTEASFDLGVTEGSDSHQWRGTETVGAAEAGYYNLQIITSTGIEVPPYSAGEGGRVSFGAPGNVSPGDGGEMTMLIFGCTLAGKQWQEERKILYIRLADGSDGSNAKYMELIGKTTLKNAGRPGGDDTTTITAVKHGFEGNVGWQWLSSGDSWQATGWITDSVTVDYSEYPGIFINDICTLKCYSLVDPSIFKTISINVIRDGDDGESAKYMELTGNTVLKNPTKAGGVKSTTITATLFGIGGDVGWEYRNNTDTAWLPTPWYTHELLIDYSTHASIFYNGILVLKCRSLMDPSVYGIVSITVVSDGDDGQPGRGVVSIIEQYYLSNSSVSQTGGSWQNSVPVWTEGKYVWTSSLITYSDSPTPVRTSITLVPSLGGTSIVSADVEYSRSQSPSVVPSSGWQTSSPLAQQGWYIWSRTKITYSNGVVKYTVAACISGFDGPPGLKGQDGQYTVWQFAKNKSATTAPTSGWQSTQPTLATGDYLWARSGVVIPPATAPTSWSATRLSGEQGPRGLDGRTQVKIDWQQGSTHYNDDEVVYYIYMRYHPSDSDLNGTWWKLRDGITSYVAPVAPDLYPQIYERVQDFKTLAVNFLIAEEANLANFIFKTDMLMSLFGRTHAGLEVLYGDFTEFQFTTTTTTTAPGQSATWHPLPVSGTYLWFRKRQVSQGLAGAWSTPVRTTTSTVEYSNMAEGGTWYTGYTAGRVWMRVRANASAAWGLAELISIADGYDFFPNIILDGLTGQLIMSGGKNRFEPDGSGILAGGNIKWTKDGNIEILGGIKSPFVNVDQVDIESFWEGEITSWANNFLQNQATTSLIVRVIPCRPILNGQTFRIHAYRRGVTMQGEVYNAFQENGSIYNELTLSEGDALEIICVCVDGVFRSWDVMKRYKCRRWNQ